MADMEAIRRGLAANLRATLPIGEGQVSPYLLENPTPPCLQVGGLDGVDYTTLGFGHGGDTHRFVIEACLGRSSDVGAQKLLDELLSGSSSVKRALESNRTLTSRLREDGTVQTGHAAAADWVKCREYRGQSRFTLPNGVEVLLASWLVEVAA